MTINAIETRYAGCRFRSRLEARWAVFFDYLGWQWEYEPQGYLVGAARRPYLPDFVVTCDPRLDPLWVEVKGTDKSLDLNLMSSASQSSPSRVLVVLGPVPKKPGRFGPVPLHTGIRYIFGHPATVRVFVHIEGFTQIGTEEELCCPEIASIVNPGMAADVQAPDLVRDAYEAARSARFEHGENGAAPRTPRHPRPDLA